MSETVHYRGTLKEIKKLDNESLEEQCKRLLGYKDLESYSESYQEELLSEHYKKYVAHDDVLYLVDMGCVDTDEDIFHLRKDKNGSINFEVKYYNGGCGFNEAIELAFENKE